MQSSGILIGTAPAPDLANDFAFMHEFKFLKVMIDKYDAINSGNEPLYPHAFVEQYGASTKQYIDDNLTVSLGSQIEGPTFEHIIKQQGYIYGLMYPSFVEDADEEIENPISLVKEQSGKKVHFLDMEIIQSKPGVSQIRKYDKRDHMATLDEYRRYPQVETRLSQSCIYATLHRQLCRVATRCTEILYLQIAAAKLIKDIIKNR